MSTFGEDLIQSLNEALAHSKGEGPAIVHTPIAPREARPRRSCVSSRTIPTRSGGHCWADEDRPTGRDSQRDPKG